ncbi:MAG: hypothetical protein ACU83P_07650 [Gammaproteobacteria bacterium]
MDWSYIQQLTDNKLFVAVFAGIGGGILTKVFTFYGNRLKTLEYNVSHERIGISANDAVFGDVRVTWQGRELPNLFLSTATLKNMTNQDYSNLEFKVFSGQGTDLLNQSTEITGTTYTLNFTEKYASSIQVAQGAEPTHEQFNTLHSAREFLIPTLNRGQQVVVSFLTTSANGNNPSIWLDTLHQGVAVKYRPLENHVFGVPLRLTLPIGLIACFIVLVLSSFFISEAWIAGLVCMMVGLSGQAIGALCYRLHRFITKILIG